MARELGEVRSKERGFDKSNDGGSKAEEGTLTGNLREDALDQLREKWEEGKYRFPL